MPTTTSPARPLRPAPHRGRPALAAIAVLAAAGLLGLAVAPDPAVAAPAAPAASTADLATALPGLAAWTPEPDGGWWTGFGDPVLDGLMARIEADARLSRLDRTELQGRVALAWVQRQAVAFRARQLEDWGRLLALGVAAWTAQGPTPRAAAAVADLQRRAQAVQAEHAMLDGRLAAMTTVVQRLVGADTDAPGTRPSPSAASPRVFAADSPRAQVGFRWADPPLQARVTAAERHLAAAVRDWHAARRRLAQVETASRSTGPAEATEVLEAVGAAVADLVRASDPLAEAAVVQAAAWIELFTAAAARAGAADRAAAQVMRAER